MPAKPNNSGSGSESDGLGYVTQISYWPLGEVMHLPEGRIWGAFSTWPILQVWGGNGPAGGGHA